MFPCFRIWEKLRYLLSDRAPVNLFLSYTHNHKHNSYYLAVVGNIENLIKVYGFIACT